MTPTQSTRLIGLIVGLAALSACGDSKLSAVKDSRMRGDEFTFGETLGKIKECTSTEWTSEIVNNTTMVTHTCAIKLDERIFKMSKERAIRDLEAAVSAKSDYHKQNVARIQEVHSNARAYDGGDVTRLNQKLASIEEEMSRLDQPFVFVRSFLGDTEELARPRWEADRARRQAELAGQKQRVLNDIENTNRSQQARLEQSARVLQAIDPWLGKYDEALAQTRDSVAKEIDVNYDRSHSAEVRTVFRYREGKDAEPIDAGLVVDGRKKSSPIPIYLIDPKRMREYITYMSKDGFGMDVAERFNKLFPIENDRSVGNDFEGFGYKYKESGPAT